MPAVYIRGGGFLVKGKHDMSNRPFYPDVSTAAITVASAVTVLPFPPVVFGDVTVWNASQSVTPIFEVELHAATTTLLTLAELYGGTEIAVLISDDVDTVDFANDELDITTHGLETGDGPLQLTTTTTLPAGLDLLTNYFVIKVNDGTIQLALTFADALAGTAVTFSDAGIDTHTLTGTSAQTRVKWLSYGFLGPANDGALTLLEKKGYVTRVNHRPRTKYYAVSATLSVAVATTITVHPVLDFQ